MAPPDSIWHKESLKLKERFGTREGFEICPNNFSPRPNVSPPCSQVWNTSPSSLARNQSFSPLSNCNAASSHPHFSNRHQPCKHFCAQHTFVVVSARNHKIISSNL